MITISTSLPKLRVLELTNITLSKHGIIYLSKLRNLTNLYLNRPKYSHFTNSKLVTSNEYLRLVKNNTGLMVNRESWSGEDGVVGGRDRAQRNLEVMSKVWYSEHWGEFCKVRRCHLE